LKWSSTEIQPFCVGIKIFPKLQDVYRDVDLEQSTHLTTQSFPRKLDLAYVTCKIPEITGNDNLLPGLTGFNTLLSRPKLVNSTVAYLPAIDAPVTEYSTVKEVLKRSVEMADKLELNFMVLVFGEAVYAKIQHIRWMDSTYRSRFIVRLGEFHTIMSFCGAIAKRFQDAGLQVQYCSFYVKVQLDIAIGRSYTSEYETYTTDGNA
jgi:hypothetical protein